MNNIIKFGLKILSYAGTHERNDSWYFGKQLYNSFTEANKGLQYAKRSYSDHKFIIEPV
jgi:hypothetical protein